MEFSRHHRFRKRNHHPQQRQTQHNHSDVREFVHPEHTGGSEASYLKSLVDSHAKVTVVLTTGEKLQGRIRYYDQDCFSIGLSAKGPRLFIRKENVSYIAEEQEHTEPRA